MIRYGRSIRYSRFPKAHKQERLLCSSPPCAASHFCIAAWWSSSRRMRAEWKMNCWSCSWNWPWSLPIYVLLLCKSLRAIRLVQPLHSPGGSLWPWKFPLLLWVVIGFALEAQIVCSLLRWLCYTSCAGLVGFQNRFRLLKTGSTEDFYEYHVSTERRLLLYSPPALHSLWLCVVEGPTFVWKIRETDFCNDQSVGRARLLCFFVLRIR